MPFKNMFCGDSLGAKASSLLRHRQEKAAVDVRREKTSDLTVVTTQD